MKLSPNNKYFWLMPIFFFVTLYLVAVVLKDVWLQNKGSNSSSKTSHWHTLGIVAELGIHEHSKCWFS